MDIKSMLKKQSTIMVLTVIAVTIGVLGTSYAAFFKVENDTKHQTVAAGDLTISYTSGSNGIVKTNVVPMAEESVESDIGFTFSISNSQASSFSSDYEVILTPAKYYLKESFHNAMANVEGVSMRCGEIELGPEISSLPEDCRSHVIDLFSDNASIAKRLEGKYIRYKLQRSSGSHIEGDTVVYEYDDNSTISTGTVECLTSDDITDVDHFSCLNGNILTTGSLETNETATYLLKMWLISYFDEATNTQLPPNSAIGKYIAYNVGVQNTIKTPVVTMSVTNGSIVDVNNDDTIVAGAKNTKTILNGSNTSFYIQATNPEFNLPSGGACDEGTQIPEGEACLKMSNVCYKASGAAFPVNVFSKIGERTAQSYDRIELSNVTQDLNCSVHYSSETYLSIDVNKDENDDYYASVDGISAFPMAVETPRDGESIEVAFNVDGSKGYAFKEIVCTNTSDNTINSMDYNRDTNILTISSTGNGGSCTIEYAETFVKYLLDNVANTDSIDPAASELNMIYHDDLTDSLYYPIANENDPSINQKPELNFQFNGTLPSQDDLYITRDFRYQGANPSNYMDFSSQAGTSTALNILWRIVGVIQTGEDTSAPGEYDYSKYNILIRDSSLGTSARFNIKTINNLRNHWIDSTTSDTFKSDFTNFPQDFKDLVEIGTWFLGGVSIVNGSPEYFTTVTPATSHFYERSVRYPEPNALYNDIRYFVDRIEVATMSLSDYGYASSVNNNGDACETIKYGLFVTGGCTDNNWIHQDLLNEKARGQGDGRSYTLTPAITTNNRTIHINSNGAVAAVYPYSTNSYINKFVYLKNNVIYLSGNGSNIQTEDRYKIL